MNYNTQMNEVVESWRIIYVKSNICDKILINNSDATINDVITNCIKMVDSSKNSNSNRLQKIYAWVLPC